MLIEVYSKSDCPYCKLAKAYLDERSIPFTEVVYDEVADRQKLYDMLGLQGNQRTVPQIFVEEKDGSRYRIGGYNDLLASDVSDRFAAGNFDADF